MSSHRPPCKRTLVTLEQSIDLRDRQDFVSCETYGSIEIEPGEVGAIVKHSTAPPKLTRGLWVSEVEVLERFFVGSP